MDVSQKNNCLKIWVFKNKHYTWHINMTQRASKTCVLISAVFPFSLFWPLAHQLFKKLTWLGVTLGNVVFSFSFEEVFVREPPLFHPWLCLFGSLNTSLEAELKLWIINVSEPELRTRARSPWENINIQNVQTCKLRGRRDASHEDRGKVGAVGSQFHPVAFSSLVCCPCGLHFNCFQSKFDEFVTREEAGKCSGLLSGGAHRQIWGIRGWLRHLMADCCEDFNTATMTAMLGPFYVVIWNRSHITHTIRALPYLEVLSFNQATIYGRVTFCCFCFVLFEPNLIFNFHSC